MFSPAPEATYFNLNGHTYNGREHWIRLWQFYGQNVQSAYWAPYDIGGTVGDALAVVWCHRKTRRQWTGNKPRCTILEGTKALQELELLLTELGDLDPAFRARDDDYLASLIAAG